MKIMIPALALLFASHTAAAQTPQMEPTTLTVTAEARAEHAPDLAEIGAGVVTTADSAAAASRSNADAMGRVIAAARRAGIAERDIRTSGFSLQPQYAYEQGQPQRLTGYRAENTVTVRLRELARAGAAVDALVAAGANQITGPSFRIADEDAVLDSARAAALAKARARAELYARAAGLRVARILRIREGGEPLPPRPVPFARTMAVAAAPTPIQPGEVELSAEVTVEFALE